jgi:XTP/dITP diphosphohydrolase
VNAAGMQMHQIFLASRNPGKLEEITDILSGVPVELVCPSDFEGLPDVDESGSTYFENAVIKAKHYSMGTGLIALADDSGLEVDALGGLPGIRSNRYFGENLPGELKIECLLERLKRHAGEKRTARFRCVAVLMCKERCLLRAEGKVEGEIAMAPAGVGGFGYDPVFFIPEFGCTMAELDSRVKNRISHRAGAMMKVREFLLRNSPEISYK